MATLERELKLRGDLEVLDRRDPRRTRGASTAFVLGRLVERQRRRRERALSEWPVVWTTLRRRGRKAWS